ncbi:hypothetical protein SAZ11_24095 [Streptomyces sp. FXJ1.4098]|nr:hypothetical protein [Streptomyces sp. FXJ1.4098]
MAVRRPGGPRHAARPLPRRRGDLYVVAHNLRDLFWGLLDEEFDGPAPTRQTYLDTRQAYLTWLERNFGPTAPTFERSPMEEHGWRFVDWLLSVGKRMPLMS